MDVLLPQLQPQDCDLWDSSTPPLYILAARRGSQFVDYAFKLLDFLESSVERSTLVFKLSQDEATDDHTVRSYVLCTTLPFVTGNEYHQ